jgi:hypothetical protein
MDTDEDRKYVLEKEASCRENLMTVLEFYDFQLKSYRKAVDTWTFVRLRNNVVKDIRLSIGKLIGNRDVTQNTSRVR